MKLLALLSTLFQALVLIYGYFKQKLDSELQVLNQLGSSVLISRAAGLLLTIQLSILLIPVCKVFKPWFYYFKLDPTLVHLYLALSMLLTASVHTYAHYLNFFLVHERLDPSLTPLKLQ
jgi:NADPH oxidase